jgi:capsular exopolysaccharide synthesis family protein
MNVTTIKETNKLDYSAREAFKFLRTNFLFCGNEYKTILITSSVKNEGKSTISIELAKSLAVADKKVLLIDADLRKSVYASQYTTNTQEVIGLSEYLSGQAEYSQIYYSTQFENLSLIFAGAVPPNPVELLGSKRFDDTLKSLREQYDYVIIDAAPLGAVIDASVISAFCDGSIIVVSANEISYRFANEIKNQLEKSGCKVLGAILNKVSNKPSSYYNRYYKKYYGKYSKKKYGSYGYNNYGYGYGYGDDVLPKNKD